MNCYCERPLWPIVPLPLVGRTIGTAYCEATNGPASFNVQLDKICPAWAYATFYVQLDTVHIRVLLALALLPHGVVIRVVRSQIPFGAVPVAATPLAAPALTRLVWRCHDQIPGSHIYLCKKQENDF